MKHIAKFKAENTKDAEQQELQVLRVGGRRGREKRFHGYKLQPKRQKSVPGRVKLTLQNLGQLKADNLLHCGLEFNGSALYLLS